MDLIISGKSVPTYKVDKLDRWIVYKFSPKGKFASPGAVPERVTNAELDRAKSKYENTIRIRLVDI